MIWQLTLILYSILATAPLDICFDETSEKTLHGILDRSIPIELTFSTSGEELIGHIQYGMESNSKKLLEGRIENDQYIFYEIQENAVSSVIKGHIHPDSSSWSWSRYNYSLELPIHMVTNTMKDLRQIKSYSTGKKETSNTAIFLPDSRNFYIATDNDIEMRWMDYECANQDCYEIRPDGNLDNPLEFVMNKNGMTVLPDQEFKYDSKIEYQNTTVDSNHYILSYNYPIVDKEFDAWIHKAINDRIQDDIQFNDELSKESDEAQRLTHRNYGNFYISLLSENILSGYLIFHSSSHGRMQTIPFSYDRDRRQFMRLRDLFKKDFDYSFFLRSYLGSEKRKLVFKEEASIKEMIKQEAFGHFAIAPGGLVFFTEFNTLYGRRHIQVPYEQIASFVKDKSLASYISKGK